MKEKALPGLNIQYPISQLILSGEKTIETRTYCLPQHYVGVPMVLVETPGKQKLFPARAVAVIEFGNPFLYRNERDFWKDSQRHRVTKSSPWAWNEKPKWGWPIARVRVLRTPQPVEAARGIRFTKAIEIQI